MAYFRHLIADAVLSPSAFACCFRESARGEIQRMRSYLRFAAAVLLLTATALFLRARAGSEVFPSRQPLASFPRQLGNWVVGNEIEIPQDIREILGPGE